jgi:hypothetical protein
MKSSTGKQERDPEAFAAALVLFMSLFLFSNPGWGEQSLPMTTTGYQTGFVTAVYETNFQINGRTYSFAPNAEVSDDRGNHLDVGAIRADIEVKFHVKNDQNDKIDKIILYLPR